MSSEVDLVDPLATINCPYPGLRPFRREESVIFHGREELVDRLLARLRDQRFLAVVGSSGCGKSSLVRAGLIPGVELGLIGPTGVLWQVAKMHPGRHPFARLADALAGGDDPVLEPPHDMDRPSFMALVAAALQSGPRGLVEALHVSQPSAETHLLLVVDQFEEIFRLADPADRRHPLSDDQVDPDEADAFVALLLETARQNVPVYIVLTMRSDYLGECARFRGLPERLEDSQFLTPELTLPQTRAAVERPARVFGGSVEPDLVEKILSEIGSTPDKLSLMQHALMHLWKRAEERGDGRDGAGIRLRLADYQEIGGIAGALNRHADEVYRSLPEPLRHYAERMFRQLCEVGTDKADIRRPAPLQDVIAVATRPEWTEDLAGSRLGELWEEFERVVEKFRGSPT